MPSRCRSSSPNVTSDIFGHIFISFVTIKMLSALFYWRYDHLNAQVLLTLVANPYLYTDKASDFVQEASTLQATGTKQDADDVSIPISHIDGRCHCLFVLLGLLRMEPVVYQWWKWEKWTLKMRINVLRRVQTSVPFSQKISLLWKWKLPYLLMITGSMYRIYVLSYFYLCSVSSVPGADGNSS